MAGHGGNLHRMKATVTLVASLLWLSSGFAQDCFRWDGKINGKPARLMLDTGYGGGEVFVFRSLADRLGLKRQGLEVRNPDGISGWPTEAVVELPGWAGRTAVRIKGQLGDRVCRWFLARRRPGSAGTKLGHQNLIWSLGAHRHRGRRSRCAPCRLGTEASCRDHWIWGPQASRPHCGRQTRPCLRSTCNRSGAAALLVAS